MECGACSRDLGAVLQVEDTPVCRIVQALRDARQQVERERAERGRAGGKSRILGCIRAHVAAQAGEEVEGAMAGLRVEEILAEENIDKAITQIKKGTVGGEDGFDTTFYAIPEARAALIDHLGVMFREIREDKRMPESMRCAGLSMLYKGKGRSPKLPKNYRPIAVTNSAYRILMKAIQLKLAPATTAVVGKTQMAYLTDGRRIWDNTLLLAGVARQMEKEGKGGAAVQVDNTAAFDRVRWDFLQEVMEAMGFPEEFREFIGEIYTDLQFAIRVNGQKGGKGNATNGVRQGCPASPLIFIIVQEALLMAIRGDAQLKGIKVVTGGRGEETEVRERCMADDTVVYLESVEQAERLFQIIGEFEEASGQLLNPSKSTGILFGDEKLKELPKGTGIKWVRFGEDEIDEGLGITIGTEEQVRGQWREAIGGVIKEMRERMSQCKDTMGTTARARNIQSAFVSKLTYKWQVQAPQNADELVAQAQQEMDAALFEGREGDKGWYFVDRGLASQAKGDGGLGQTDLGCRMEAIWADLVLSLKGRDEVWKGMWAAEIGEVYGGLDGKELAHTTCGFHKYARDGRGPEVMRRGLAAIAKLPPPRGRVMVPVEPKEGEEEGGERGGKELRERGRAQGGSRGRWGTRNGRRGRWKGRRCSLTHGTRRGRASPAGATWS